MKLQKILCALLLALVFATCKKDEKTTEGTIAKLVTIINTQDSAAVKYQESLAATGDSMEAFMAMANWLVQHAAVEKVYINDYHSVTARFKNGLRSSVVVIPVAADGTHLIRGGGAGRLTQFLTSKAADDEFVMQNNKVMIFLPYLDEFYHGNYPFLPKFSGGKFRLIPTLVEKAEADLAVINTFSNYGFIIIDSHGKTNGFTILTKIPAFDDPVAPGGTSLTEDQLKQHLAAANNLPLDKVESGELEVEFYIYKKEGATANTIEIGIHVLVTQEYIRKIPALNKAIVFGNHCFSGFTYDHPDSELKSNLPEAWKSVGAVTYYGYAYADGKSRKTDNDFCVQMEDSLVTNLLYDLDSTGTAHLANDVVNQFQADASTRTGGVMVLLEGSSVSAQHHNDEYPLIRRDFYFEQFYDKRYRYQPCGDTITDSRDGRRYATVCIGGQVWMAENLNWAGAGTCYDNDPVNCSKYGRLYSITELTNRDTSGTNPSGIRGLCPEGWHVPSTAEWKVLFNAAGRNMGSLCTTTDWPTPNNATNELEFSALPGGMFTNSDMGSVYSELGKTGHWWSCSAEGGADFYCSVLISKSAGAGGITYNDDADLQYEDFVNERSFSCRCVKD